MNRKLRAITIGVLFLLSGMTLYAQQAGAGCSEQRRIERRPTFAVCKPTSPDSQRPSNNLPRHDDGATYVTFDVSGAANGTFTKSINNGGTVTGWYVDSQYNYSGFVRDWFGNITSFDVPGDGGGTTPLAINNAGTVTGSWCPDTTYTQCPGFLRDVWGNITSFDPPGEYYGTNPLAISPNGAVTGGYFDSDFNGHGFVRTPDGSITEFDPSGSVWTNPWTISADGTIAGSYLDASGWHGFLRDRRGNISTFDVTGYTNTGEGNFGGPWMSMNAEGEIVGSYTQSTYTHDGFLRHRDGTFDTFYAADYSPCCIWTFPTAIAADKTIAGYFNDGYDINRGFVRTSNGNVTLFDVPDAGTGDFQGTVVVGMTESKVIVGHYIDSSGLNHGFLRIPH